MKVKVDVTQEHFDGPMSYDRWQFRLNQAIYEAVVRNHEGGIKNCSIVLRRDRGLTYRTLRYFWYVDAYPTIYMEDTNPTRVPLRGGHVVALCPLPRNIHIWMHNRQPFDFWLDVPTNIVVAERQVLAERR